MTVHAKPLEADMRLMNAEVGDGGAPLKKGSLWAILILMGSFHTRRRIRFEPCWKRKFKQLFSMRKTSHFALYDPIR